MGLCVTCRGFTTLSGTLGKLAVCLHEGLLQALAREGDSTALAAVLQALAALVTAAPYARLPPEVLLRALAVRAPSPPCHTDHAMPVSLEHPCTLARKLMTQEL